ncbi:MAG: PEP-CTERM sorting domain-containing protein [Phycisphaerae bacterium]
MMKCKNRMLFVVGGLALAGTLATQASAATVAVPYLNDFNDNDASDFVVANPSVANGIWTAANGVFELRDGDRQSSFGRSQAYLDVAGVDDTTLTSFSVSSRVTLNSILGFSNGRTEIGLLALAEAPAVAGDVIVGYVGEIDFMQDGALDGTLRLTGSGTSALSATDVLVEAGKSYEMLLQGTMAAGVLTLDFTVTEVGNALITATVQVVDATPTVGSYFGYNHDNQRAQVSADLDDFALNVALVPEPASLAMVGLAAGGLVRRRR